jgi:multiple sugar transport system permease protein
VVGTRTTGANRAAPARTRGRLRRAIGSEHTVGFLFIGPWIIGFVLFEAGPVLAAMYLSLTNYDLLTTADFVGLRNYQRMFGQDPLFWLTLKTTAIYSVASVGLHIVFGLCLALLLNQNVRGIALYRTVYYLPAVISGVAVAYMWIWVLNPEGGIVNSLLGYVGIKGPNWLFSTEWALPSFILMSLWGLGSGMVLYLAGLQGVPTELYETAALDGAGPLAKVWYITIPMISPVIFFNFVVGMISSFQVFTSAYVMTNGGPANATLFYVLNLYRNAFQNFRMGYAAALGVVLFVIVLLLTLASFRMSRRMVYYEGRLR